MSHDDIQADTVDLVYPLSGQNLPREHGHGLLDALSAALPWLASEPLAGVHTVKLVQGGETLALLSPRARLLLRLPRARVDAAAALGGRTLDVAGSQVRTGAPHVRELVPYATLYTHCVAAPGEDEAIFMQTMDSELQTLGVRAQVVCGKRHNRQLLERDITTFSLMLHGLSPAQSLRVQDHGLGPLRQLGCGIFVPHKSAAAVGE